MDSYDDSSTGKEKRSKHKSSKSDERSKRALQRVKEESAKFTLNDRRALAKAKAGSPAKKRPRSESSSSEESSGSSLLSSHVKPKAKSKKSKGVRIWINGLSSDINEGVIKATFERYGSIKSITMYRGSCSLEYKDSAGAFNALKERDNTNFHGNTIRVSDRPPLPPTPVTAPPTTKGKEQKPATRQPPPEEKELWIGGLGPHYNEAYIQGMLEVFGDVVSLEVHNGWCYAKFKYPDDAAAALKELQSGTLLHGSNIQAKYKKDVNPAKIEAEYPSSWEKPAEPSKSKAEPILKKRAARSESAESVASRSPSREQRKAARTNKGAEQPPVDWRAHPAAMGMGYYYPPYPDPAAWEAMMARGGPYPPAPYPMPYPPYPMPRPGENPYQKTSPRRSRSRDRKDDRDRDRDRSDRDRDREKDKDKERGRSRSRSKSRDRDRDRKDDRSRSKERSPKRKERSRSHERSRKDRSRSRDRRSRSRSRDRSRKRSRSPKRSRSRSRSRPKKELDRNFRKDWYADDANVKRGMDEEAIKAGRELWVGGLDPESDDVEPVRTLFEKHGVVTAISLRKAWCFLTYSDPESAKEAIDQLDGHKAFGRPLRVTLRTLPPGARDRGGSPKRGNSPS